MQLAPAARLHLAVDADVALLHELARVRAGLGDAGELQQLSEADRVVADLDVDRRRHAAASEHSATARASRASPSTISAGGCVVNDRRSVRGSGSVA